MMNSFAKSFLHDTDGAVTVDWVILTAAIVGLGLIAGIAVKSSTAAKTETISTAIATELPT